MIGIGHDPASGQITIGVTIHNIYDTSDVVEGHDTVALGTVPIWLQDSPYFFAFYSAHNPFFLPYMLAVARAEGKTDEEAADWIADTWEQEIFRLSVEARVEHEFRPVAWDDSLGMSARTTAITPGIVRHVGPNNSDATRRARDAGWAGGEVFENSTGGSASPAAVLAAWLVSEGHRSNILLPDNATWPHTHLGVGFGHPQDLIGFIEELHWSVRPNDRQVSGGINVVQQFGRR